MNKKTTSIGIRLTTMERLAAIRVFRKNTFTPESYDCVVTKLLDYWEENHKKTSKKFIIKKEIIDQ